MILLKRKLEDGTYFEFDKILYSGYHIKEDKDRSEIKLSGVKFQIIDKNDRSIISPLFRYTSSDCLRNYFN